MRSFSRVQGGDVGIEAVSRAFFWMALKLVSVWRFEGAWCIHHRIQKHMIVDLQVLCLECSMRWPLVCKVEFAKTKFFFDKSLAKVVRYDLNTHGFCKVKYYISILYRVIFREHLAKVLIKLGERRPSLEATLCALCGWHGSGGVQSFLTHHHPRSTITVICGDTAPPVRLAGSQCLNVSQSTWSWPLESRQISLATRCDGHTPTLQDLRLLPDALTASGNVVVN